MAGPMSGIKVVEMGVWVAGPAAGGILADWGADVVKIEPPGIGDPGALVPDHARRRSALQSDLRERQPQQAERRRRPRQPEGLPIALDLIGDADVFVTNIRPAGLARLGLDPDSLLARFPRLVYGS